MFATIWGTGQVLLDMLWFFLFAIEIWLMITIFVDIFRRHDMRGWVKALWVIFVIFFPLIGILVYLVVYGDKMRAHAQQAAMDNIEAIRAHLLKLDRSNEVDDFVRLADLKERGFVTDDEFARIKARILAA